MTTLLFVVVLCDNATVRGGSLSVTTLLFVMVLCDNATVLGVCNNVTVHDGSA